MIQLSRCVLALDILVSAIVSRRVSPCRTWDNNSSAMREKERRCVSMRDHLSEVEVHRFYPNRFPDHPWRNVAGFSWDSSWLMWNLSWVFRLFQLANFVMPTKKGEQWYADWIVAADVYMDLAGSPRDSKDEVLHRLDELLRQQGILARLIQYVYACMCA